MANGDGRADVSLASAQGQGVSNGSMGRDWKHTQGGDRLEHLTHVFPLPVQVVFLWKYSYITLPACSSQENPFPKPSSGGDFVMSPWSPEDTSLVVKNSPVEKAWRAGGGGGQSSFVLPSRWL